MNKATAIFYFLASIYCSVCAIHNEALLVGAIGFMVVLFRCKEIESLEGELDYLRAVVREQRVKLQQLKAGLSA